MSDTRGVANAWALPARVDHPGVPALLGQCREAVARGVDAVDLAACHDFDSSLIGVLLELRRMAQAAGRTIRFTSPPDNLRKLADLYGVGALLFPAD